MDPETQRPFYMIFSSRSLENITDLIENFYSKVRHVDPDSDLNEFRLAVPDKFNNQQTMRTIVVIDPKVFELLKESEDDLDEFKIEKLKMKKHFYPNVSRKEEPNLYISLPKTVTLTICQSHLIERMTSLRDYGIWTKTDYKIHIPKLDRLKDTHNGVAFIYFNKLGETRLDDIVLSRLFVNNTKWPDTNLEVHCYWSKTKESFEQAAAERAAAASTKIDTTDDKNVWILKGGKHKV